MALVLTDSQKCALTIQPINAAGNAAPVDGVPEWSVSSPDILSLEVADDGMSATVVTTGTLGASQVNVLADADLGDGIVTIGGVLDVDVQAGPAVSLAVGVGIPEEK